MLATKNIYVKTLKPLSELVTDCPNKKNWFRTLEGTEKPLFLALCPPVRQTFQKRYSKKIYMYASTSLLAS